MCAMFGRDVPFIRIVREDVNAHNRVLGFKHDPASIGLRRHNVSKQQPTGDPSRGRVEQALHLAYNRAQIL